MCAVASELRLTAVPPFDGGGVLRWLGARLVPGVEELSGGVYRRTLRLPGGPGIAARPGLRARGAVDPAETAVRAVLGQQVSLAAARTLAGRLVALCSELLQVLDGALTHAFPAPAAIPAAPLERIGMPEARRRTLRALCGALAAGELDLGRRDALLALPGIGPWTADYIALRAGRDPDA